MVTLSSLATSAALALPALWLGAMAWQTTTVAPAAFRELEREVAGRVVGSTFPAYFAAGAVLGLAGGAAAWVAFDGGFGTWSGILQGAAGVVSGGVGLVLVPRMRDARERGDREAFRSLHGLSMILNLALGLTVLVAVLAAGMAVPA